MGDRAYLSIGEVLTLLRDEFPDVTISKIRFLESQGLLDPERTASGYRKFYEPDVERLRWILRQQREHFLPLKVIKGRLGVSPGEDAADEGSVSVGPGRRPVDGSAVASPAPSPAPTSSGPSAASASAAPGPSGHPAPPAAVASAPVGAARVAPSSPAASPSVAPAPVAVAGDVPAAVAVAPRAAPAPEPPMSAPGGGNTAAEVLVPPPAPPVVAGPAAADRAVPAPSHLPPVAASAAAPERQVRRQVPVAPVGATPNPPERPPAGPPPLSPPAKVAPQPATASFTSSLSAGMTGVSLTIEELASATGLPYERLRELERYGFIAGRPVAGTVYYDEESLVVANLAVGFARFGIEGRHLRIYKNSAEREAGLFEQIVTPLLKQRNPEARRQAVESLEELTRLGQSLRAAVLRQSLRRLSGG